MAVDLNAMCMTFLMFINQQGTYKPVDKCPEVQVITLKELQQLACKAADCPARGFYDRSTKTIYLSTELDLSEPMQSTMFLHELVHYAQDVSGNWEPDEEDCRSLMFREYHAYRIQEKYLMKHKIRNSPIGRLALAQYAC